jgi:hypothetical protein
LKYFAFSWADKSFGGFGSIEGRVTRPTDDLILRLVKEHLLDTHSSSTPLLRQQNRESAHISFSSTLKILLVLFATQVAAFRKINFLVLLLLLLLLLLLWSGTARPAHRAPPTRTSTEFSSQNSLVKTSDHLFFLACFWLFKVFS